MAAMDSHLSQTRETPTKTTVVRYNNIIYTQTIRSTGGAIVSSRRKKNVMKSEDVCRKKV
jgi:hypothetical protein